MQSQIFEQTTSITSTAIEVFNSETYLGGALNVSDSVYIGVSIANTGSSAAQLQVDVKMHPNGAWISHTPMAGSFAVTSDTNITNSFYRQLFGISTGSIAANGTGFFSVATKFVYAIRILSRMTTGSSGNSIRVRGNIKIVGILSYKEESVQQSVVGTVNSASVPVFTDVSDHAFMSIYFVVGGSSSPVNIAANTLPNQPTTTSGNLLGIRFYPGDSFFFIDTINGPKAMSGNKNAIVLEAFVNYGTGRTGSHRYIVEAAYELGFLWNIPGGSTVDYYVSLNG